MNMGRVAGGYADLTVTSSLSPCPFCQCCLALHMGVQKIRILDATNYKPDFSGYARVGLTPDVCEHPGIVRTFRKWVRDRKNALIWSRDIGLFKGKTPRPFDVKRHRKRCGELMDLACQMAIQGERVGEAPIGAVIIDSFGEVIGCGHPQVVIDNDPSAVAAMSAWRACGSRDHWKDKTLMLTCGPDHIAYSMFHIFRFGQLAIGSDKVIAGRAADVRRLGIPVHVIGHADASERLAAWIRTNSATRVREYLGASWTDQA
jgi:tRNA(Arg) A34 adenosine deaminase TadA